MGYASRSGRAKTSSSNPEAFGVCQRCGFWYQRSELHNQYEWRGAALLPLYVFVCDDCYDKPQEQLRAIVVPADPVPVYLPLPEPFTADEEGFSTGPYGQPVGLTQAAIMPLSGTTHYGVSVPVISLTANGTTTISATCSQAHGLSTDDQISIEGISSPLAAGFYSIVVTSATAFNYATFSAVPAGSLLTPTTRIVTASVGLPLGYTTIPQVGP